MKDDKRFEGGRSEKSRQNFNRDIRKNFFTIRTVPGWNALPDGVRDQKTIGGFKNAYDIWRLKKPEEENLTTRTDMLMEIELL